MYGEMGFARSVMTRMTVVVITVVDHIQSQGSEGGGEQESDFVGNRAAHGYFPEG